MSRFAGVDGCPGGWLCIVYDPAIERFRVTVFRTATEMLQHDPKIGVMAIDMPIGLAEAGRRHCDELARNRLGARHVCVMNAPIRPALYAPSRLAASAITEQATGRRVGSNEWALYPKIINLDIAISPALQAQCVEIHPELGFSAWNGGEVIAISKLTQQGRQLRERLIDTTWPGARLDVLAQLKRQGHNRQYVSLDDVNDAFAAVWTACRIGAGQAERLPEVPEVDSRGLRMEIWF